MVQIPASIFYTLLGFIGGIILLAIIGMLSGTDKDDNDKGNE